MRPYPLSSDALVDDVLAGLDGVADAVRASFATLTPVQLAWQPSPKRWSAGHCLLHLARTGEAYRGVLGPAIDKARAGKLVASTDLVGTFFGRLFTGWMAPGRGMKMKSPDVFRPDPERLPDASVEHFLAEQRRLRALALSARGLDLDGLRVASPASSLLRFTAGDAMRILVEHEWRHIRQAEAVVAEAAFPRKA